MMQVFTEKCHHFSLNVNVDVIVVSNMNSNSSETKLHNFWTTKLKVQPKLPFLKQTHRSCFFIFFFYVFWEHKRDMRLIYLLIVLIFLQIHLHSSSCQKTYMNIKAFKKIEFFTIDYIQACVDLNDYRFNYVAKFYTIPKLKLMNNKSFLQILLSGDISLYPVPVFNNELLDANE